MLEFTSLVPKYQTIVKRYFQLSQQHNWGDQVGSAITLPGFLCYIEFYSNHIIVKNTWATYYTALKEYHLSNSVQWDLAKNLFARKAIRQMVFKESVPENQDDYVTIEDIKYLYYKLDVSIHDQCIIGCLIFSLFFGLGRISDLLHNEKKATPSMHYLSIKRSQNGSYYFRVEYPKIEKGYTQFLNPLNTQEYFPQAWIICMLSLPSLNKRYPWSLANGDIITPKCFKDHVYNLIGKRIGESSFRAGGTTHLISIGLNVDKIILLGRWESEAWRRYIRCHNETLQAALIYDMEQRRP